MNISNLANSLPVIHGAKTPWFVRTDENVLRINGELENSYIFLDYYGEYRGGYPWIHEDLMKWAENHGGFWEWENPSNIAFYKI